MNWTLPDGSPFVGNESAKALLSAAITDTAFPHAILIEGPIGSGRRTLGRLIAAAAVCENRDRPCGACPACHKAAAGTHPDITEIDSDGSARSFHIDVVRSLKEDAYILPNEAPKRVFLLCDVQNMTEQAQNALLKILEEPPAQVVFVLTCERRSQLLDTVLSRVFPVALSGVSPAEAVDVLRRRLPDRSPEDLEQAVALTGGVIGQALRGLEDGSYRELMALIPRLAAAVVAPSEWDLLLATAPLARDKEAIPTVLSGLQAVFRDALAEKNGSNARLGVSPETATTLARSLTSQQLLALLATVEDLTVARLYNMNQTLFLTVLCARLRRAAGR